MQTTSLPLANFLGKRIAVFADIHANLEGFRNFLGDARAQGCEEFICLGDIWSYGCHPDEVFSELRKLESIMIYGNHECFYFKNPEGTKQLNLPAHLRESIEWTQQHSKCILQINSQFSWLYELQVGEILFTHANPYGNNDWSYLNSDLELQRAGDVMRERGVKVLIYGHTHRKCASVVTSTGDVKSVDSKKIILKSEGKTYFLNPGSIGQPRGDTASYLILDLDEEEINFHFRELPVTNTLHLSAIQGSELSVETKEKLISYFK